MQLAGNSTHLYRYIYSSRTKLSNMSSDASHLIQTYISQHAQSSVQLPISSSFVQSCSNLTFCFSIIMFVSLHRNPVNVTIFCVFGYIHYKTIDLKLSLHQSVQNNPKENLNRVPLLSIDRLLRIHQYQIVFTCSTVLMAL